MNIILNSILTFIIIYIIIGILLWIWWCLENFKFTYKHKDGGGIKPVFKMCAEASLLIIMWGILMIIMIED